MECNAARRLLASLGTAVLMLVATATAALEGQVIDGSTGKPLQGVYVIGAWRVTTFMPVHAVSACAKLDLTRTDRDGRFVLPNHSGRLLPRLFGTEDLNVYYFLPGYRFERGKEWRGETIELVSDSRSRLARLHHLRRLTDDADCDELEKLRMVAIGLYRALYDEAKDIAVDAEERSVLSGIHFMLERLQVGEDLAKENAKQRLFKSYR